MYNSSHIVLDQVYAYDQGYNALEAMAKGKVVFTGAEQEWLEYYHIKEDTVAINALPDAIQIAKKLAWLIDNPEKIIEISKRARTFIEQEHDYIKIAQKYIDTWTSKAS
jgi:glycosyltransferase involved in cell wall biosynthesis